MSALNKTGDEEGLDSQLELTTQLLRIALETMAEEDQACFFLDPEVLEVPLEEGTPDAGIQDNMD